MKDASNLLPNGWTPEEELVFETAECRQCDTKAHADARAWAHQHVKDTGHAVRLFFGYDVRDEHWFERLSYERQAEIERLMGRGKAD